MRRRNVIVGAACAFLAASAVAVPVGVLAGSSYLALYVGHVPPEALARPWMAWWTYATNGPDLMTKAILTGSAIPPVLFGVIWLAICAKVISLVWFKPSRVQEVKNLPLYGNQHVATEKEMESSGMVLK